MEYLYKTTKEAYIKLRGGGNCIDTLKEVERGLLLSFDSKTLYDWIIKDIETYSGVSSDDEKTENNRKKQTYLENLANYLITKDENNESNLSKIKNFIRDGTKHKILLIDGMNLIRNDLFFISMLSVKGEKKTLWKTYTDLNETDKSVFTKRIELLREFIKILSKQCENTKIILFYHGNNKKSLFEIDNENEIGYAEISCHEQICNPYSTQSIACHAQLSFKKNEVDDYTLIYVEQLFRFLQVLEKNNMEGKTLSILSGDRYAWLYKKVGDSKRKKEESKQMYDTFNANLTPRVFIKFSLSENNETKITCNAIPKNENWLVPNKLSELYIDDDQMEINNEIFNHIYINKWDTNKIEYAKKVKYVGDNDKYEDDINNYKQYSDFLKNNREIILSDVMVNISLL